MKELLTADLTSLAQAVAVSLESRGISARMGVLGLIKDNPTADVGIKCTELYQEIRGLLDQKSFFQKLVDNREKFPWIGIALFSGEVDDGYNLDRVAMILCEGLVQRFFRDIDDYVEGMNSTLLLEELGIAFDKKNSLVSLSNNKLRLERQGLILDESSLLFPHQFLRRYYSGNFVGMPSLLKEALEQGLDVCVRLDPFRRALAREYQEVVEADHWFGAPFEKLRTSKYEEDRTVHKSNGYYNLSYHVDRTIFRTRMRDESTRSFTIEEYCPTKMPAGNKYSGLGEKYIIQKFAHFYFDQSRKIITHLDGAVRVFLVSEYEEYFSKVELDADVDTKIGERHKIFLVEGVIDLDLAQALLTEWFRYNPHIEEYFTGQDVKPFIAIEQVNGLGREKQTNYSSSENHK